MAIAGDDINEILQKVYDIIMNDVPDYAETWDVNELMSVITTISESIIDAIRCDVMEYKYEMAERIREKYGL